MFYQMKKKVIAISIVCTLIAILAGCSSSTHNEAKADFNGVNKNYLSTPKYMKTPSVQKLIAKGYSFSTIAVDPNTKCEYFVSNTIPVKYNFNGSDTIATATTWKRRETADGKIVTYQGHINKLK